MRNVRRILIILNVILCIITFCISAAFLASAIWQIAAKKDDCTRLFKWPTLAVALLLSLTSLIGIFCACKRTKALLIIHRLLLLILILVVLVLTICCIVLTREVSVQVVNNKDIKEYRLENSSTWIQTHLIDKTSFWRKIGSCLAKSQVCKQFTERNKYTSLSNFYMQKFSPLQSGCCKPPVDCNFTFLSSSATWVNATSPNEDGDCGLWNNSLQKLCFECKSCTAGLLQSIKDRWITIVIVGGAITAFFIVLLALGFVALPNPGKNYVKNHSSTSRTKTENQVDSKAAKSHVDPKAAKRVQDSEKANLIKEIKYLPSEK
ncbi:hypothetical protein KP509_12G073500 [Ceratopteris richardii]|uniref:Tetraspanin-8-like n=1 Tax=Ceratopteris richardii TaxID=49495 RepID=A0A8T2TPT0_CERRI|nr:hypothetical protein KP509_12G073500 [Ceratopteris richardii]